ncbi:hypothetical protein PPL_04883 [Heterostelium album PN500]|uniref:Uncharacterized protein n=1 Tax=Heterostelium pallidum (strain ATCC 26659 / Pp 5 / PN500) TaxID=670386 RepID=D3B8U0_HETP5|nr:hypothetical protein PPL_04883 [Heterostelium album PN500]EFA82458.1 hypothetical protein PPL_04883 [Heterostelium album PN500]|eukprot:XP_020434575.1 hypothetical protein PPL_04883 [Heterostelium album PN500]
MDFSSETPSIEFISSIYNQTFLEIGLLEVNNEINNEIKKNLNQEVVPILLSILSRKTFSLIDDLSIKLNSRGYLFSGIIDTRLYYTIGLNGTFYIEERENIPTLYSPQVLNENVYQYSDGVAIFTHGSFVNSIYYEYISPYIILKDSFATINLTTSDPDLLEIIPYFSKIPDHQVEIIISPVSTWVILDTFHKSMNEFNMTLFNPSIQVSIMVIGMPDVYAKISLSINTMATFYYQPEIRKTSNVSNVISYEMSQKPESSLVFQNVSLRFFVDSNSNNVFDSNETLYTGESWVIVENPNSKTEFQSFFGSEIVIFTKHIDSPTKIRISTFDNHYPISPIYTIQPYQEGQIKSESLVLQFNTGTYNTTHFGYCPTINSHLCIHYSVLDFPPYCEVELEPDGILTVSL